jgi:hypothetical protein
MVLRVYFCTDAAGTPLCELDLWLKSSINFMNSTSLPIIGVTMGDAAGIGPEIIIKSLWHPDLYDRCLPLVIGDAVRLPEAGRIVNSKLEVNAINNPSGAKFVFGIADCIDLKLIPEGCPGVSSHRYVATPPTNTLLAPLSWPRPGKSTLFVPRRSIRKPCMPVGVSSLVTPRSLPT